MDPPAFVANEDGSIVSDQSPPAQIDSSGKPDQLSDNKDTESLPPSPIIKKQIKSVLKSSKYSTVPPIISAPITTDDAINDNISDNDNNDAEKIGGGSYLPTHQQQAGNTNEQRKSSSNTIATDTVGGGEDTKGGSDDKNEEIIPASAVAVVVSDNDGNQQPSESAKITPTEEEIAVKKEKQKKQFFAVSISLLLLLVLIFGLVFGLKKDGADDNDITIDESNNLRGEVESVPTVQPVTSPPWLDHWILETALEPVDPNVPIPLDPNAPIEDTTKEDLPSVQDDVPTNSSTTTPSSPTTTILADGNCADVVNATARRSDDDTWTFDVTISSPYETVDQYADEFQIISISDDIILGTRSLAHPHPSEQPFTRSLGGIIIPSDLSMVSITARDSINGYCGEVFDLELPSSMIQQEPHYNPHQNHHNNKYNPHHNKVIVDLG